MIPNRYLKAYKNNLITRQEMLKKYIKDLETEKQWEHKKQLVLADRVYNNIYQ